VGSRLSYGSVICLSGLLYFIVAISHHAQAGAPSEGFKRMFATLNSSAIRLITEPGGDQATGFLTRVPSEPDFVVLVTNNHVFQRSVRLIAIIPASDSMGIIVDTFATRVSLTLPNGKAAFVRPTDTSIDLAAIAIGKNTIATSNKGYWQSYGEEFFAKPSQLIGVHVKSCVNWFFKQRAFRLDFSLL
jgi:hypothetical protein